VSRRRRGRSSVSAGGGESRADRRRKQRKARAGCAVSRVLSRRPPRASASGGEGHLSGPAFADGLSRREVGKRPTRDVGSEPPRSRCLALHPVGFAVPASSRSPRCALTAPFHPCRRLRDPADARKRPQTSCEI